MTESGKSSFDACETIDLLIETSWEVCNKIGGIYTVLSTKAKELKNLFGDRLVFIGPDVWDKENESPVFTERKTLLKNFSQKKFPEGISVRCGRWKIPGSPLVILVDFKSMFQTLDGVYGRMWERYGVDSLHGYGDYDESNAFSLASAIVISRLISHLGVNPGKTIAHFDEWTTGMGLLDLKSRLPEVKTIFTTHATTIGRSICGNGKPLYQYFQNYNGDQMAAELNVQAKHSLEKAAAWNADCFTTVSEVTARECEQLLEKRPDVVTPNGFEPSFVPDSEKWSKLRKNGRKKILEIASLLAGTPLNDDSLIVATSGRNEFRNKGLDLFLDSMARTGEMCAEKNRNLIALILVPAWVKQPSGDLLIDMEFGGWVKPDPDYLTHRLNNEDSDAIACNIRYQKEKILNTGKGNTVHFLFVPCYLDGHDGIVNISYYDLLPAVDISVFGSYYEPWGYTPLESIAFGVPTVTTDKAGFGQWAVEAGRNSLEKGGVVVVERQDTNYGECVETISDTISRFSSLTSRQKEDISKAASLTSRQADWKFFISKYIEAFRFALNKN